MVISFTDFMNADSNSLIEGIGDEVLIIITVIAVLFIILLWLSKSLTLIPAYFRIPFNSISETTPNNENLENTEDVNYEVNAAQPEESDICFENVDKIEENERLDDGDNQANNSNNDDPVPQGYIQIKIKYLDERVRIVNINPFTSVFDFKNEHFRQDIENNKNVRLIFNGKELKDNNAESTVAEYGIVNKSIVHCLITQKRDLSVSAHATTTETETISTGEINIGSLLFPLLGVLLSLAWYYRLNYKTHFNIASTFVLVSLSGIYFVACFVNYSQSTSERTTTLGPTTTATVLTYDVSANNWTNSRERRQPDISEASA